MEKVRDTKFTKNISNEILLNAGKIQGYSFYHFWVIKKKTIAGGGNTIPPFIQIRFKIYSKRILVWSNLKHLVIIYLFFSHYLRKKLVGIVYKKVFPFRTKSINPMQKNSEYWIICLHPADICLDNIAYEFLTWLRIHSTLKLSR